MSIIGNFQAIRTACDAISKHILGPPSPKLPGCELCDFTGYIAHASGSYCCPYCNPYKKKARQ